MTRTRLRSWTAAACISLAFAACDIEEPDTNEATPGSFATDRLASLGIAEVQLLPDEGGVTARLFDVDGQLAGTLRDDRDDGGRIVTVQRNRFGYSLEHDGIELRFFADGQLLFHKTADGVEHAVHDARADFHAEALEIVAEVLGLYAPLPPLQRTALEVPSGTDALTLENEPSFACSLETGVVNPATDPVTTEVVKSWTCDKQKAYKTSMDRAQAKCQQECGQACSDTNFEGWDYITSGKNNAKWTCGDTDDPVVFAMIKWYCPVCPPPPGAPPEDDEGDGGDENCCVYDSAIGCC